MLGLLVLAGPARAQKNHVTFTLGSSSIDFPSADPSTIFSIAANENPIFISVKSSAKTTWNVSVLAGGDLLSGSDTIPISNVSWTATGASFVGGTLSSTVSRTVGSGEQNASGTLSFFFANSWNYPAGAYEQTITFTVMAF
ncbi:MAG TPA: hypothetical protein VFA07_19095 [Chthonomonadaceae bacterium]|nr:hypothetical protein [Chthonomonadaceae bacterium]